MAEAETELLNWSSDPGEFRGDIGVAVRLDGGQWRDLGARFHERDDGQGESPMLAVGNIQTSEGAVDFGVLDYGEGDTYLLVPATGDEIQKLTAVIAKGLEEAGVLSIDEDLEDEESSYRIEELKEEIIGRLTALEQFAGEVLAKSQFSMVPVATHIIVSGDVNQPEQLPEKTSENLVEAFSVLHTGTLKWLQDEDRAVISPEDGSDDVLVEVADVNLEAGDIPEGTKVSYRYGIVEAGEGFYEFDLETMGLEGKPYSSRRSSAGARRAAKRAAKRAMLKKQRFK